MNSSDCFLLLVKLITSFFNSIEIILSFSFSNLLSIIGLAINTYLAVWIVKTVQHRLNNRRVIKNHFIEEIKEIRGEYKNYYKLIMNSDINPKSTKAWFKVMSIKTSDLTELISQSLGFKDESLKIYNNSFRDLITDSEDFERQYNNNKLKITTSLSSDILKFHQGNQKIFNCLIVEINNLK